MLTEICQYLKNWFNRRADGTQYPAIIGEITITDGFLVSDQLVPGQYIRIIGSLFNDGVHKHGVDELADETFIGAVWPMAIPQEVVQLADEIAQWQTKYGGIESHAMTPYQSESFGGYTYSKAGAGETGGAGASWQSVYQSRLAPWRKL